METTTIAVRTETLKLLQKAKNEMQAGSMNTLIETLVQDSKKQKKSMFGALKHIHKEFRREEIDRFG